MKFDITHKGRTTLAVDYNGAIDLGYPASVVGAALKAEAVGTVSRFADSYRAKIASTSAGKLAEYRIKEEIARTRDTASDEELALISREAKARGTNRTGLLNDIEEQATAYRQITLLIGVIEAETKAAVQAVPDDAPDIEAQIATVLNAAREEADTEFTKAIATIKGG